MEDKISKIKEGFADKLDMPRDVVLNIPKIIVVGKEEITIENHQGILKFNDDFIRIKCNFGNIVIKGCNFEILFISGKTIILGGKLKSVEYEGD
ncbi:sporulation protein YqfC [Clostridium acidisoli DSM 12555]|jgi:sporulation protein YqfC|uniref:Sporulation protein YqfC n=1 Tax=Clostridium acidisoli DSM 12555 TaxID=1121291 RepID=A0A1W1X513_9CLOT|nr:sporulation protein YqfC [Clostridium acidisoli]SMC18930.1 sporulation protein YqfC [Clostridium acidisoli DSM 12555]